MMGLIKTVLATAICAALCDGIATAEEALTLARALDEAHEANARLPLSRLGVSIASEAAAQSRARLGPSVGLLGQLRYTPPGANYGPGASAGEEILQIVGRQPLYAGGSLRAQLAADRYGLRAAEATFRADERDLELMVRSRFSAVLELGAEIAARADGIDRLRSYQTFVWSRKAAGQGVETDLLKTAARLATQEADLTATRTKLAEAELALNDLLGRDPSAPLLLAPLPPPEPPHSARPPSLVLPDIAAAAAERSAAEEQVRVAGAQLLPQLSLAVDTGLIDPGVGQYGPSPGLASRLRDDFGVSVGLDVTWNLWSFGLYRARNRQARLSAERAAQNVIVTTRAANLAYARAVADLDLGFEELLEREAAVPIARDAFVQAESVYRGGAGTALDVLDAFTTFVEAEVAYAQTLHAYRVADGELRRWSSR